MKFILSFLYCYSAIQAIENNILNAVSAGKETILGDQGLWIASN